MQSEQFNYMHICIFTDPPQIRDAEYLRAQEERRKQNTATETESRMRNSTVWTMHSNYKWLIFLQMVKSDASTVKADVPKRQREQSEREKEATALRRQVCFVVIKRNIILTICRQKWKKREQSNNNILS